MLRKLRSAGALVVVVAALGAGCKGKSAASSGPVASSGKPATGTHVDAALVDELKTIGKTCERVQGEGEERYRCAGAKNWALIGDFLGKKRDRGAAIGALAQALADPEPGVRGLAASVLSSAFASSWGKDKVPGKVEPAAATSLLESALKLPPAMARQALPAAVNAAMLAGQAEPLYRELDKAQHAGLRPSAYSHVMTFGRLQAFVKVQQLASGGEPEVAAAALEAPLNMAAWTTAEEQTICGWAEAFALDQRQEVAAKANLVLGSCPGEHLDRLLARSEQLAAENKLDATAQHPLVAMCNPGPQDQPARATADQCRRARDILTRVAESMGAEASARTQAIRRLVALWPDAQAKVVLERLAKDESAEVTRQASKSLQTLSEAGAKQGTEPVSQRSTPAPAVH